MLALMCEAGESRYALDAFCVVEVVPCVRLEPAAATPEWLAGTFSYRGRAVHVADLTYLTTALPCPRHLSSRIIVAELQVQGLPPQLGLLGQRVTTARIDTSAADAAGERAELSTYGRILMDAQGMFQLIDPSRLFSDERRRALQPMLGEGRR